MGVVVAVDPSAEVGWYGYVVAPGMGVVPAAVLGMGTSPVAVFGMGVVPPAAL
jgi:hypothetical protein